MGLVRAARAALAGLVMRRLASGPSGGGDGGPDQIQGCWRWLSVGSGAGDDPEVLVVQFCWSACGSGVESCGLIGCERGVDRDDRPERLLVVLAIPGRAAGHAFGVGRRRDLQRAHPVAEQVPEVIGIAPT
jgi:hypothetical protein